MFDRFAQEGSCFELSCHVQPTVALFTRSVVRNMAALPVGRLISGVERRSRRLCSREGEGRLHVA